jgi:hypothetical protein
MDGLHESKRASRITKERFKTVVYVLLDVAVKESEARLIGSEIYDHSTVIGDYDCILNNAGGFFCC